MDARGQHADQQFAANRLSAPPDFSPPMLADRECHALADLLPLLGCGEEAAAVAFHRLAERGKFARATRATLQMIGDEERVHDALLAGLAAALAPSGLAAETRTAARHFHIQLGRGSPAAHLARIAAIDAAVCLILARLTARRAALGADPSLTRLFTRIRHDEARHVAVARSIVIEGGLAPTLRDTAAGAREALGKLIAPFGATFEALKVDADRLGRDVARLPDGLL